MSEKHQPLFETAFLRSVWAQDFESFKNSPAAGLLLNRLTKWAKKDRQKETSAEAAMIAAFFVDTWGYRASGTEEAGQGFSLWQQFPVKGAGQRGGTGAADVALGLFGRSDMENIPQVLGEFKDDRSGLDKPQKNRPNDRSPVDQCLDYLREARTGLISGVMPTWGFVTDMNEFRLYLHGNKAQYQRFVIQPIEGDSIVSLLEDSEEAAFQRFLFSRCFHADWLLASSGQSKLQRLQGDQITHEQALENEFYLEYQAFREAIFQALRKHNPDYEKQGRLNRLVRYTQRFLDRCLFILYCEDMGSALRFPPHVLRDLLIEVGGSKYYNAEAENAWSAVKQLFASMRDGTPFGSERINRFNGGLFAEDADMDALHLPNRVFCAQNQGQTPDRLLKFPQTLLYFSAKYNFGTEGHNEGRTLTLTAMGRIFEQSITDLEVMEAHAEGRESLSELTKRKRDGVYYTPEWVTYYIVQETVGARLAEIRKELGLVPEKSPNEEDVALYRAFLNDKRRAAKVAGAWIAALKDYRAAIRKLKVVDPACGSGAFLIQALKFLINEHRWIAEEQYRVAGQTELWDQDEVFREILSQNIYGVDINAESVEITRLALWLHTALPDRPLTVLDKNIRCGNSLIGHDFYEQMGISRDLFGEDERERVNTFDWKEAFPEVYSRGNAGFDCVIGNPPYVKLQHFRKIQEDVARYLLEAKIKDGPLFESTQTGNFDMYLPFIERGIELLNQAGKMGYIAPNVWMVNEYGQGLRKKLARTRRLERWVDFKNFQVFDEAITYTALQFFSGTAQESFRCVFAPTGKQDTVSVSWPQVQDLARYDTLPADDSWVLMPEAERYLHSRLREQCDQLEESCKAIVVGLQTSADHIYHFGKAGPGRYLHWPSGKKEPVEVEIEDAIMHPLVSGLEAKRYQVPDTSTYILFPYQVSGGEVHLFTEQEMEKCFPKAWAHLKSYERALRGREKGKFDDKQWWRFGRNQNIDKQDFAKLMVPRLVARLFTAVDSRGEFYLDNVDVNGILVNDPADLFFLAGILNSPVANFIWRRISKPFQNDFYSANKQFIAPLPIPRVKEVEKAEISRRAERLQGLHTKRRDIFSAITKRLLSAQCEEDVRSENWLWSEVKSLPEIKKSAPPELKGGDLTAWTKAERERRLVIRFDRLSPLLRQGAQLTVENRHGELVVLANGATVIDSVFVDTDEAEFIAAQWRHFARQTNVTEKFDGKRLVSGLLKLRKTDNAAIKAQVVKLDAEIQALDAEIAAAEADMNALTYKLYRLTDEEIALVERG